ncbi:helix-turn-helix domain-containing protein [Metabacillus idriensis]|uniref:helix-turn-helix domain-containing protein n=1 Tax=Metabacillus idriensis TaxID=324768 RepID=UPI00174886DC|nr:helix-turn-helix domain-containing protein [Metabacillus idriensis]
MEFQKNFPFIMTAKHVAEILGINVKKAYQVMEQKDFPLIRIGTHKKVNREAFFNWIDSHAEKGGSNVNE